MRLPRGCRFDPKERELIEYLVDKVEGRPDACQGVIKDGVDVYGCSPDQLFGASTLDENERLFCFTQASYRKTGRDRSTPEGHWKSIKGARMIYSEGRPVGSVLDLRYYHGKKQSERSKWGMKEYTLLRYGPPKVALSVIYCIRNMSDNQRYKREYSMTSKVSRALPPSEWFGQNKFQNTHENLAILQSESTQIHNHLLDPSEMAINDECGEYLKMVAAKAGENYSKLLDMARNMLKVELAQPYIEQKDLTGPSNDDDYFNSSQGSPSPAATSLGYSSVAEACSGSNNVFAASEFQDQILLGDDSVTSACDWLSYESDYVSFGGVLVGLDNKSLFDASASEGNMDGATTNPNAIECWSSLLLHDFEEHQPDYLAAPHRSCSGNPSDGTGNYSGTCLDGPEVAGHKIDPPPEDP